MRQRRERGGRDTLSGLASWALGRFFGWAEWLPRGLFHIFISSLPFLFLLSYFFSRFCITPSNQFKPLSEVL
jgi:hypothetical protein